MKCRPTYVSVSSKLRNFSQYSSLLTPQFSAKVMNLFHNKRQNNKMSSQTYPNSQWLYTPLMPLDIRWSNNQQSDITGHSPIRPFTYLVTALEL